VQSMKIKIRDELIPLNGLVLVLILIVNLFPTNVIRLVLGLPFLLFFPGYTLVAALFPEKTIDAIERVALAFGLSLAMVPLIGLVLNYTPWTIRLEPVLYSTSLFIFAMSIIAWVRRKGLPQQRRFAIEFQLKLPGWSGTVWDKALSIALVLAVLGALGTLAYAVATPKVGERFTEFYILGAEGKADNYPKKLTLGVPASVILGIVNWEQEPAIYRVEIKINQEIVSGIDNISLNHEEKWEQEVSFAAISVGTNQKVELILYKAAKPEPYQKLHLWVDVK